MKKISLASLPEEKRGLVDEILLLEKAVEFFMRQLNNALDAKNKPRFKLQRNITIYEDDLRPKIIEIQISYTYPKKYKILGKKDIVFRIILRSDFNVNMYISTNKGFFSEHACQEYTKSNSDNPKTKYYEEHPLMFAELSIERLKAVTDQILREFEMFDHDIEMLNYILGDNDNK